MPDDHSLIIHHCENPMSYTFIKHISKVIYRRKCVSSCIIIKMPDTGHLLGEQTQHSSKKTTNYFTNIFLVNMAMNSHKRSHTLYPGRLTSTDKGNILLKTLALHNIIIQVHKKECGTLVSQGRLYPFL
jgi:hypothetical protein